MVSLVLGILTSKWGLIGLAALAVGIGLIWFYYDAKAAGAAGVLAAALAETARRSAAANKARTEVKHDPQSVDQDADNRDHRPGG